MPREILHVRIQPIYKKAVRERAKTLNRSHGYVIEEALYAVMSGMIGSDNLPGKRMDGDEVYRPEEEDET